jgi:hypothetical protein
LKHKIPIKPAGTKGQKSITAQNHNWPKLKNLQKCTVDVVEKNL